MLKSPGLVDLKIFLVTERSKTTDKPDRFTPSAHVQGVNLFCLVCIVFCGCPIKVEL